MPRCGLGLLYVALTLFVVSVHGLAWGHGVVGQRFFPESLSVEDPFPSDEADFPAISFIKGPEGKERAVGLEYSKRLSPNLAFGFEVEHVSLTPADPAEPKQSGLNNPELFLKYAMLRDPEHEAIVSVILSVAPPWGDKDFTERNTTVAPGLIFGKGLGGLPDGLRYLKPIALGGAVSLETPLGNITDPVDQTSTLNYGFIVEYSIPYLQSFVKDIGLSKPFSRMIPIVEFSMATPVNGPDHGATTAYMNPGVIWSGKFVQFGAEALIPLNDRTGHNVGVLAVLHWYLDDLAPNAFTWTPFHGTLGPTRK